MLSITKKQRSIHRDHNSEKKSPKHRGAGTSRKRKATPGKPILDFDEKIVKAVHHDTIENVFFEKLSFFVVCHQICVT